MTGSPGRHRYTSAITLILITNPVHLRAKNRCRIIWGKVDLTRSERMKVQFWPCPADLLSIELPASLNDQENLTEPSWLGWTSHPVLHTLVVCTWIFLSNVWLFSLPTTRCHCSSFKKKASFPQDFPHLEAHRWSFRRRVLLDERKKEQVWGGSKFFWSSW